MTRSRMPSQKCSSSLLDHAATVHARTNIPPSIEYQAWVGGKEVYVWNHTGFAGGTMSWIFLDLHSPVEVRVRPHRQVDEVRVVPRRSRIETAWDGTTATLQIEKPGSYFMEWDQCLELPFFIFARPPELETPAAAGGQRIEFGPGEHRPGRIELKTGDELYLAPGAEVYGAISANGAQNIRITGRGILRQSHLPFGGVEGQRHPVEMIDCKDVLIDGPIFLDGCTWNIVFRNCDRVQVRNITVLSERPYSTDGINPCDSRDVLIENCFARCKDDCISVKGLQRNTPPERMLPIHDITVRDCLFWSDNNNGLVVGTETWASEIRDIVFQRTDFVRVAGTCGDWAAAFAVQSLADTRLHGIVFEDIDVEYCSGNPFSILFLDEVYGIHGERREGGGVIENIRFANIRFHQIPRRHSLILGKDPLRLVQNVLLENIRFDQNVVSTPKALRLETNAFTRNVRWSA